MAKQIVVASVSIALIFSALNSNILFATNCLTFSRCSSSKPESESQREREKKTMHNNVSHNIMVYLTKYKRIYLFLWLIVCVYLWWISKIQYACLISWVKDHGFYEHDENTMQKIDRCWIECAVYLFCQRRSSSSSGSNNNSVRGQRQLIGRLMWKWRCTVYTNININILAWARYISNLLEEFEPANKLERTWATLESR